MTIEDQLRSEMARVQAQIPPGLARAAYQRHRRRRAAMRAITAAGTAVVVIGAAVGFGLSNATGTTSTVTPAYVVDRVTQAIDAIPKDAITFERTTYHSVSAGFTPEDDWASGGAYRSVSFTAAGQPATELGFTHTRTTMTTLQVNYQRKTWSRSVQALPHINAAPRPPASTSCAQAGFVSTSSSHSGSLSETDTVALIPLGPSVADLIRTAQSCGTMKVAGTDEVDGTITIKLVERAGGMTLIFWVRKSAYLPVRYDIQQAGMPTEQTDIQYLPPTPANRAKLAIRIPAGFKQVPPPDNF